jgi:hypothetical protein
MNKPKLLDYADLRHTRHWRISSWRARVMILLSILSGLCLIFEVALLLDPTIGDSTNKVIFVASVLAFIAGNPAALIGLIIVIASPKQTMNEWAALLFTVTLFLALYIVIFCGSFQ